MDDDCAPWASDLIGATINEDQLRLVEILGEGAYGVVFRAIDESSPTSSANPEPRQFAVKIMERADTRTRRWRAQQREVASHLTVSDHPNIVSVHDVFECEFFIYIVLDLCVGGDLFNPMIEKLVYCRNDALIKSVFVQLLDAVQYCHDHGVYHRDLKPDNILTNEDGSEIKLADFGLSTTAKVSDTFGCGSQNYMSPECIGQDYDHHPYSTEASDIWALGVILSNLVAGRNPWDYATMNDKCFMRYLVDPNYLREILPISQESSEILQAIFTTDPGLRITIPALRERILAVETFFMSDEDLEHATMHVQMAAAVYSPPGVQRLALARQLSICTDSEALRLLQQRSTPLQSRTSEKAKFAICSSSDIFSDTSSTTDESDGPITPQTRAQDPVKLQLAEIPDFGEKEKIGTAVVPVIRKGRSLPSYYDEIPPPIGVVL
ncbi:Pkinase-domain-containing protein [Trametes sanguinea]|nr:Pkinase-domain-containing protein [Trametes sanguinea]